MSQPLIALDGDGVLIDYHAGYREAWRKAFGELLQDVHPTRYHAKERFAAPALTAAGVRHLHTVGFDEDTWQGMPVLPGAVEACELLAEAGARVVVVSALPAEFAAARHRGLAAQGVLVERVYATGGPEPGAGNPKAPVLRALKPVAMVDDFLPFLEGLPVETRRVLIEGTRSGSPNAGYRGRSADEVHPTLLAFARGWLARAGRYTPE